MDKANLRLSAKEAQLVANADWILTKNEILQKVKWMLEDLQSQEQVFLMTKGSVVPSQVTAVPPKISRGENYKGLPWLVLDYPRYFGKNDHFAIRSMFWWGNFFSITLQLSGAFKEKYQPNIQSSFSLLQNESFFIAINDDQWEHHFEPDNYLPLAEMGENDFKQYLSDKNFIKLAKKIPLEQWNEAEEILLASFVKLIGWLGH
jgi:hypothetical protein